MNGPTNCSTGSTLPLDADTDGDKLRDGREVNGIRIKQRVYFSKTRDRRIGLVRPDPCDVDTDNDRLRDKAEVTGGRNAAHNNRKSDPTNWDTDFGRVSDGREVAGGSDPSNVHSGLKNPRLRSGPGGIG